MSQYEPRDVRDVAQGTAGALVDIVAAFIQSHPAPAAFIAALERRSRPRREEVLTSVPAHLFAGQEEYRRLLIAASLEESKRNRDI
jgi:hypothetical protein